MKIEAGKYYETRGGEKAYVVGIIPDYFAYGSHRFMGLVGSRTFNWEIHGHRYNPLSIDDDDIIAPWTEEEWRPLEGDELKELVGTCIVSKQNSGVHYLVTSATNEAAEVDCYYLDGEEIMRDYTHKDGSPIGKPAGSPFTGKLSGNLASERTIDCGEHETPVIDDQKKDWYEGRPPFSITNRDVRI